MVKLTSEAEFNIEDWNPRVIELFARRAEELNGLGYRHKQRKESKCGNVCTVEN